MPTGKHNGPRLGRTPQPIALRFANKYMPEPNTGCWLWIGNVFLNGYGSIRKGKAGLAIYAHRVSYELHHGPIPEGLLICHKCDVRNCVNPDHLYAGTNADNARDRVRAKLRSSHHGN